MWQDWEEDFRRRFDVMALQRNLKALGTFGYQTSIRQNPVYIQYIPRTLHHVQRNLARHDRFARLREISGGVHPGAAIATATESVRRSESVASFPGNSGW